MTFDGSVSAVSNEPARRSQARGDIPLAAAISDDGHRFPVVSCEHSFNHAVASGVKANTVADAEFQHLGMRTHLLQETKPLDNPVIQVDQFSLAQPVDVGSLSFATLAGRKS